MLLVSLIEDFNSEVLDQGHLKSCSARILTALACKGKALDCFPLGNHASFLKEVFG
jgi:hypothetical protein